MLVNDLLDVLRERLRLEIRNGRLTERGLARRSGISQAHMHNVLKGVRMMTPSVADRILAALELSVSDLLEARPCRKGPETATRSGRQEQAPNVASQ
jgi:transcriptional regulator with XRE-family HTH domain